MELGYIRVSTPGQNPGRQIEKMKALGVEEKNIYMDAKSGKDFDRDEYRAFKRAIRAGDVIYLDSLDRLGRNYNGIIDEWREITRKLQADIVVLDHEELFDSRRFRSMGEIGQLLEDQLLAVLAYVAQQRRDEIRRTQREGIELARKQGKKFGRPRLPDQKFKEAYEAWKAGKITGVQAMAMSGYSKTVFYRRVRELSNEYN